MASQVKMCRKIKEKQDKKYNIVDKEGNAIGEDFLKKRQAMEYRTKTDRQSFYFMSPLEFDELISTMGMSNMIFKVKICLKRMDKDGKRSCLKLETRNNLFEIGVNNDDFEKHKEGKFYNLCLIKGEETTLAEIERMSIGRYGCYIIDNKDYLIEESDGFIHECKK